MNVVRFTTCRCSRKALTTFSQKPNRKSRVWVGLVLPLSRNCASLPNEQAGYQTKLVVALPNTAYEGMLLAFSSHACRCGRKAPTTFSQKPNRKPRVWVGLCLSLPGDCASLPNEQAGYQTKLVVALPNTAYEAMLLAFSSHACRCSREAPTTFSQKPIRKSRVWVGLVLPLPGDCASLPN